MLHLAAHITEAASFVRSRWDRPARAGVILGTGLGNLAREIDGQVTIPYESIPHFPALDSDQPRRAIGLRHARRRQRGGHGGAVPCLRRYSQQQLNFPVRVMKALGADTLIVSNACGGMNPFYRRGDIMVIDDHINLLGDNPLIGVNDDALGPRFPDMSCPYDPGLIECSLEIARRENFVAHRGVYVAVTGPNLETRAEYRFLRTIGADVVGMSTVPEVIVAVHAGMRVLGLSVITDMCFPDALEPANIDMILAAAAQSEPKLARSCWERWHESAAVRNRRSQRIQRRGRHQPPVFVRHRPPD